MKIADTYLYYPYIEIPNKMLVNALLFQDKIERIVPEYSQLVPSDAYAVSRVSDFAKSHLGGDGFIVDAQFAQARGEVAEAFCQLLDEASKASAEIAFLPLLGENYKRELNFKTATSFNGSRHFVYAAKFDSKVCNRLEQLGWLKHSHNGTVCEMKERICDLYMTVLACAIARDTGKPVSTNVEFANAVVHDQLFKRYFFDFLPPVGHDNPLTTLCVNLLLSPPGREHEVGGIPVDEFLTFEEAVRVRAGLDQGGHRKGFSDHVEHLLKKTLVSNQGSVPQGLEVWAKDLRDCAMAYREAVKAEICQAVAKERLSEADKVKTALAITTQVAGSALDAVLKAAGPGGFLASIISPLITMKRDERGQLIDVHEHQLTTGQHAALFMNRIWDQMERKGIA